MNLYSFCTKIKYKSVIWTDHWVGSRKWIIESSHSKEPVRGNDSIRLSEQVQITEASPIFVTDSLTEINLKDVTLRKSYQSYSDTSSDESSSLSIWVVRRIQNKPEVPVDDSDWI